jgi:Uma2 family endonuclease
MTAAECTRPKGKAQRLWTYDQMVAELPAAHQPMELWNGEIIISPVPHPNHQRIVREFQKKLGQLVEEGQLGEILFSPVDVVLTQRRVVQPDVIFISKARLGIVKDYIDGIPDLAMEVISEQSWKRDRIEKKALYEQFGLPEYWVVDPDSETIVVFALTKGVYQVFSRAVGAQTAKSKLISGFGISFKKLLR